MKKISKYDLERLIKDASDNNYINLETLKEKINDHILKESIIETIEKDLREISLLDDLSYKINVYSYSEELVNNKIHTEIKNLCKSKNFIVSDIRLKSTKISVGIYICSKNGVNVDLAISSVYMITQNDDGQFVWNIPNCFKGKHLLNLINELQSVISKDPEEIQHAIFDTAPENVKELLLFT